MKRKKSAQGYAVIFLETDLANVTPVEFEDMSDIQKRVYLCMREEEKAKVQQGIGTIAVSLGTGETICDFNMETFKPPKSALDQFARSLLPEMKEFFSKDGNRKKLEEWKSNNKGD